MTPQENHPGIHERFKQLGALAYSGTLTASEWFELKSHLAVCEDCRETYREYQLLTTEGIPFLAANYADPREREDWDDSPSREKLLVSIDQAEPLPDAGFANPVPGFTHPHPLWGINNQFVKGALAACLGIAVIFAVYGAARQANHRTTQVSQSQPGPAEQLQIARLAFEKRSGDQLVQSQLAKISEMQAQTARQEQEVGKLRAALRALESHSRELEATNGATETQLREVAEQRDGLKAQLQEAEQSNQALKAELVSLRTEHERVLLHTASLESRISDLSASGKDQERKIDDDERFLASDRDIRELMGARKLYIADVFDVDSGSRTRKPFGRIFYTQSKSLIFYAFDLDRQAGVKNASIFQVWGQKDAELGEKPHATNLGILYMDSESNRRWVLRVDDSKQLGEIDAVFVTVEPHVGNPKPTGKPFLYALLRKEANHP